MDTLETCPHCEGDPHKIDRWTCPTCLGVGRVPGETVIDKVADEIEASWDRGDDVYFASWSDRQAGDFWKFTSVEWRNTARAAIQAYLKETM